jgi:hypothetical protein
VTVTGLAARSLDSVRIIPKTHAQLLHHQGEDADHPGAETVQGKQFHHGTRETLSLRGASPRDHNSFWSVAMAMPKREEQREAFVVVG